MLCLFREHGYLSEVCSGVGLFGLKVRTIKLGSVKSSLGGLGGPIRVKPIAKKRKRESSISMVSLT